MRTTEQWLSEYGESHQNPFNKMVHWICVPSILFSLIGILWSIPAEPLQMFAPTAYKPFFNWATLALFLALLFYIRLSWVMAVGMFVICVAMIGGVYYLSSLTFAPLWAISVGIFVVAWIGQFYGHNVEGKKPSFIKDVQFLLIGPAWLLSFIYKKVGIKY
ncbi:MAG: DUF962 domain-containing protein [Bacteroidetes bacterium]|jgi:uncharacterized membrane protein YGL010W|nr:MAG: DUF962 domain-containing protein [Bacteroidota bacterium]